MKTGRGQRRDRNPAWQPKPVGHTAYHPRMGAHNPGATAQAAADHLLRMSGRGAFYSFSFDLGPGADLVRLANKLLKKDMATVAGSPSRKGLRIGRRLRTSVAHQEKAQRFSEFLEILYSDKIEWRRLFRLNWRFTVRIWWLGRKYIARYLIYRILFGQPKSAAKEPGTTDSDDTPESIIKTREMVKEAAEGLGERIFDRYITGALRLRLQQQMYFPRYYLNNEPFIRLEMNRSYYKDRTHEDEPIEISLMIHRSGVCVLTFAIPIAPEYGVDEAFKYLQAGKRLFDKVRISVPILGERPRHMNDYYHRWRITLSHSDNVDWIGFSTPADGKDTITLASVFYVYLNAIERVARRKMQTEWRCNTTLFQGSPRCGCNGAEAKEKHAVEFAQIMVRARSNYPVTDVAREELLKNYLVNSNEELWLSVGHAIHTIWNETKIDYTRDMETVEPIESAILQHRQLEAIDHRTVNVAVRDHELFAAQKQLATGLPEYGRNLMTDINAPAAVEGLAAKFRTPQLYDRLNDRVKVLESIVNTRYARKQSRRSLAISAIGLGIVLLLLLPRIDELMTRLSSLSPTASKVAAIRDFIGGADQTTVAVYCVAIGLAILVLLRLSMPLPRPRRVLSWLRRPSVPRPMRTFGYPAKHDVVVTRGESSDDEQD